MMTNRIENHSILGKLKNQKIISFTFNGETLMGFEGESLSAALLANGIRTLRYHEASGTARGIYCNIGHCYECRATINSIQGVRTCLTPLKENMVVTVQRKLPSPFKESHSEHDE